MNESSQKIYTELYALLLLSGAILFLAFFPMLFPDAKDTEMATVPDENKIEKVLPDPFRDLDITAQAIYIYDVRNDKVIFEKNGNMQLPLASVTKLMTAIIASESVPEHVVITITPDSLAKEGDTGLFVDEEWDVKDLIEYTLLVSSNDGAYALASVAGANIKYSQLDTEVASDTRIQTHAPKDEAMESPFISEMNTHALELGLKQTYFLNESGLDIDASHAGAYGSARDMAHLMAYIIEMYPELLSATRNESLVYESGSNLTHVAMNTNPLVNQIPGLLASKTGYTELAGGNLVVALDVGPAYPVVISVLGSGFNERFSDVRTLSDAVLEYYFER